MKHILGFNMNISPGRVIVKGKEVQAQSAILSIGIDQWGSYRLSSVEASLSWWRRALVNLAYWHRTPKPAPVDNRIYYDEYDELDYDDLDEEEGKAQ